MRAPRETPRRPCLYSVAGERASILCSATRPGGGRPGLLRLLPHLWGCCGQGPGPGPIYPWSPPGHPRCPWSGRRRMSCFVRPGTAHYRSLSPGLQAAGGGAQAGAGGWPLPEAEWGHLGPRHRAAVRPLQGCTCSRGRMRAERSPHPRPPGGGVQADRGHPRGTRTVGLLGAPGEEGRVWLPRAAPCWPGGHAQLLAHFVPREGGEGGLSTPAQGAACCGPPTAPNTC